MKYNRNFAKLNTDNVLDFGPVPLKVVTHHHEEWDEPIIDPETGEPTEETQHQSQDWDTIEIKIRPTSAHFLQMGYLSVVDEPPSTPPQEGWHYEPRDWDEDDGKIKRVYVEVQDPPPPPKWYSTSDVIQALMEKGVYPECREWIEDQGLLDLVFTTKEFCSDWENFKLIKDGLQELLDWTDEQVDEVLVYAEVM